MRIDIEFVDLIPLGRTGKRMGSVSKLNLDFQSAKLRDGRND